MRLRPYVFYMSQGARMRSIPRGFRRRNHCVKILPALWGRRRVPGAYSAGVTPLPIPNRAVKPRSADGTALRGGRVGRCQDSFREALSSVGGRASLFFDAMKFVLRMRSCFDAPVFMLYIKEPPVLYVDQNRLLGVSYRILTDTVGSV